MNSSKSTNTIIIGASAAGLACAACLKKQHIHCIVLEQHDHVANAWRNHYDRLHLNTPKSTSSLPFFPFPKNSRNYLFRDEFIKYLEDYSKFFDIHPLFNQQVVSLELAQKKWAVRTKNNCYYAYNVIIATGYNQQPNIPYWPGIEDFKGTVIHSSVYKNGEPYKGKKVLVIGFGNSACEISICLHEYGAYPSMSVKGGVNIIPRSSGTKLSTWLDRRLLWLMKRAPRFIDRLNAPSLHRKFGNYGQYGLEKLPYGPTEQIVKHKRIPLLDIGTLDLIKKGVIQIYPGISSFTENGVRFTNGRESFFDTIIMATGYRPSASNFLPGGSNAIDKEGLPFTSGKESSLPNVYFCGFSVSPTGMLYEIGLEAKKIARSISAKKYSVFLDSDLSVFSPSTQKQFVRESNIRI